MTGAIGGAERPAAEIDRAPPEVPGQPAGRPDPAIASVQSGDPVEGRQSPSAADDESVWPDESAEDAFLAERRSGDEGPPPEVGGAFRTGHAVGQAPAEEKETLPSLDDLVPRIPAEVRAALDDLFRAKFVAVRRMPKEALKS